MLELISQTQGVIATADPANDIDASLNISGLAAGTYAVRVASRGLYGRFGRYSISGVVSDDIMPSCLGDSTGNGIVDTADLLEVLANFNRTTTGGASDGDFDGSGTIDTADLLAVLANFNTACGV